MTASARARHRRAMPGVGSGVDSGVGPGFRYLAVIGALALRVRDRR
jgi:hypothetical protein